MATGLLLLVGIVAALRSVQGMSAFVRSSCTLLLALSPAGLIVCGIFPIDSPIALQSSGAANVWRTLLLPSVSAVNYQLSATYFVSQTLLLPFPSPMHSMGFLLSVGSPALGFLVTGVLLRRIPAWRHLGTGLLVGSPLTLALVILFLTTFKGNRAVIGGAELSVLTFGGLTNRALILEVHAWLVTLGWLAFARSRCQPSGNA